MSQPMSPVPGLLPGKGKSEPGSGSMSSQSEQARLQILWESTMDHRSTFVHYDRVAVLMLSWDDTCDDLQTADEVDELAKVFQLTYKFEVRKERLNRIKRPQGRILAHLADFVSHYESLDDSVLLIIYYAGHGWAHCPENSDCQKKELRLLAATSQRVGRGQVKRNSVVWRQAEAAIQDSEADVFLIFDCCHADLMSRSYTDKRFETLAACTADARTNIPGKTSFTSALIWALNEMHKGAEKPFFTSSELQRKIAECPDFPEDQHPILTERLASASHITLPLQQTTLDGPRPTTPTIEDSQRLPAKASYLDLRFHSDNLDDEGVRGIAASLRKLMLDQQINTHRIDLLGKNTVWKSVQWQTTAAFATHWLNTTRASKKRKPLTLDVPVHGLGTPTSPAISAIAASASSEMDSDSQDVD